MSNSRENNPLTIGDRLAPFAVFGLIVSFAVWLGFRKKEPIAVTVIEAEDNANSFADGDSASAVATNSNNSATPGDPKPVISRFSFFTIIISIVSAVILSGFSLYLFDLIAITNGKSKEEQDVFLLMTVLLTAVIAATAVIVKKVLTAKKK